MSKWRGWKLVGEHPTPTSYCSEARVDTADKRLVSSGKLVIVLKHGLVWVHDMCCTAVGPNRQSKYSNP